jgi:hypothetical protein
MCMLLPILGGCSHVQLAARSDSAGPVSSGGASVHVHGSNTLAAVVLAGMLIAGAAEDTRNPAPAMQPDRVVSEQDCTQPVQLGDNLRCR